MADVSLSVLVTKLREAFAKGVVHAMDGHCPYYSLSHQQTGNRYAAEVVRRLLAERKDWMCSECRDHCHAQCAGAGCVCFEAGDVPREFIIHPVIHAHAGVKEPS